MVVKSVGNHLPNSIALECPFDAQLVASETLHSLRLPVGLSAEEVLPRYRPLTFYRASLVLVTIPVQAVVPLEHLFHSLVSFSPSVGADAVASVVHYLGRDYRL